MRPLSRRTPRQTSHPRAQDHCISSTAGLGARRDPVDCARMDIRDLKIFVEVVRHGSFAAAARQLDMAPSMVTRSIAALEEEVGVRLMQRTTRKLSLTQAGEGYHEHMLGVLEALEQANAELSEHAEQPKGSVRITASVAYGQTVLMPLLPALHDLHPELEIDLLLSDEVIDLVAERIDIALRLGPAQDSSLIGMQLAPVRYHVCASPDYLARHGTPRVPADLADCNCLRFPLPGFRTEWHLRAPDGSVETVEVHGWLVASTALALHRAALDGLGPVLLADWLVGPDLAAGRLVDLFPEHEASATDFDSAVWLLYASRAHLPRKLRVAVDFLRERLGPA
jgi:DNA-binding transcriptional LysR family regulator